MKNKPSKFEAFSSAFNSNKRPISSTQNPNYSLSTLNPEFTPSETKSMSSTGISCLIQKSLETLLKKENFLKSADLTRISQKEKKLEFSKISNQIRMGNKSAEYKEIAFNTVQPSEYEKFKSTFQTNITNNKGHFLYTESPFTRDKQNKLIKKITKENMNWSTKDQYNNLLKKRINNNGKATIIKELKDKSMGIIAEALERKCAKEKNEDYKKEIERNMDEMIELNEVISQEKNILKIRSNEIEFKIKDLLMENQTLHQKNLFLTKHYEGLKLKYDEVIVTNSKLQKFEPSFIKLQEKLPNYSVEKLIDKFEYLENINMNFVKKISEYEDDKIQIERENQKVKERYESEILEISNKNNENQRYIESLRHQMHTQESELNDQDNYKGSYFALFDRIVHIFNIYSSKIPVYFNQKDEEQPKAKFDDPMEMLELLEKLIGISNDDKLVAYLRKIIINANLLQRKFFPENVNDKFNPEKIYDRISDLIQQLKGDILKQKTEINNLRISLEKEKSKMSMKCEIKFKERKRVHSAKPEQNNDLLPRRNAFF